MRDTDCPHCGDTRIWVYDPESCLEYPEFVGRRMCRGCGYSWEKGYKNQMTSKEFKEKYWKAWK